MINGFFGIYKEKGPTSFRVISELRKITGVRTIGHAGTLDPLARGVLVIAIGKEFTRKINEIVNTEKEYIANIKLGYESTTDDEEGEKTIPNFPENSSGRNLVGQAEPTLAAVENAVKRFVGKTMQMPPIYSAIKVDGRRAYKAAREGKAIELKPREVEIKGIKILEYNWPDLKIDVMTGKGVYIRALARDIGRELGTGAYMSDLERTRVGKFSKANSLTLQEFASRYKDLSIQK